MTIHSPHPDTHDHGLHDGCARCQEHADRPFLGLDDRNLSRLLDLALDPQRLTRDVSRLDLEASVKILDELHHVGHLYRIRPLTVAAFLAHSSGYPFVQITREAAGA